MKGRIVKIVIGLIALTGIGAGAYYFYRKKKSQVVPSLKGVPQKEDSVTESITEVKKTTEKILTPELEKKMGCSKVVNLKDNKMWEYKKCDGVWFTRQRLNPPAVTKQTDWISLASVKVQTDKLNAQFPNL